MKQLPMPEPAPACPEWCTRTHWTGGWDRAVNAEVFHVEKICVSEVVNIAGQDFDDEVTVRLRRVAAVDEGPRNTWDGMFIGGAQVALRTSSSDRHVLLSIDQADELAAALRKLGDQVRLP